MFKLTTNGVLTTLLSFNGTNGSHPAAGLAPGANGLLYGTTYDGGTNGSGQRDGIQDHAPTACFTSLVSFNGTNGANPAAWLVQGPDGNYYGTTENGGTNDLNTGGQRHGIQGDHQCGPHQPAVV